MPSRHQMAILSGPLKTAESPVCMYSDVVALRTPSLQLREEIAPSGPKEAPDFQLDDVIPPVDKLIDSSSEQDDSPWITVQHRRVRSLDSAKQNKYDKNIVHFNTKKLTMEQKETVQAAAAALTEEQMMWV